MLMYVSFVHPCMSASVLIPIRYFHLSDALKAPACSRNDFRPGQMWVLEQPAQFSAHKTSSDLTG